ncbi:hypothetical protein SCP_0606320 [Sparassis crispa]|uniref:Nucleotidyltransferase n=1 Tax=Sparassis crispa TaxID=139825 RepID=A0A401GR18_9APHY|nr:hypothetical protein SCP_0606320 [Sparassis crispa]GBE84653.1 hypothetical protein SCP_0606320 [Sparassis crispa]
MPSSAKIDEILTVAKKAVTIFANRGQPCCLFGSTACWVYGNSALSGSNRTPNDVDLLVISDQYRTAADCERLKQMLIEGDSSFFLRAPSRNQNADYRVLWYKLSSRPEQRERKCKVDILVPGLMSLPRVPVEHITDVVVSPRPGQAHQVALPVMPLVPLLLMKLKGWKDHRDSDQAHMQVKQGDDVNDIARLLRIVKNQGAFGVRHSSLNWLPDEFVAEAHGRVHEFVKRFPALAEKWEQLDFEVRHGGTTTWVFR